MKIVKDLLAQLRGELQRAEDVDTEARRILQDLHSDVERLEEADDTEISSLLDRVRAMESRFAGSHPVLERLAQELADALAKMGI
ncbi:MAG: DUF4404 family protein [Woeseia sp.]